MFILHVRKQYRINFQACGILGFSIANSLKMRLCNGILGQYQQKQLKYVIHELSGILVPASRCKMLLKALNACYKIYLSAFLLVGGRH